MVKLSVLDQSPASEESTPAKAIFETVEVAKLADKLGYHHYWTAEHHSSEGLSGSAPDILTARVAAETKGIRVGAGE